MTKENYISEEDTQEIPAEDAVQDRREIQKKEPEQIKNEILSVLTDPKKIEAARKLIKERLATEYSLAKQAVQIKTGDLNFPVSDVIKELVTKAMEKNDMYTVIKLQVIARSIK